MSTTGVGRVFEASSRAWLACAVLALLGCSSTCRPGTWDVDFQTAALESSARAVRIDVRAGTCAAPGEVRYSRWLVRGGMRMEPPALGTGPFALEASALDATCRRIASACTDLSAEACPAEIHQMLMGTELGAMECSSCADGVCQGDGDGGAIDARVCAETEALCDDRDDDDCNGSTDCADDACDGLSTTCPDSRPGRCLMGQCCSGCWDGPRCVGGHSRNACGTAGGSCIDCDGCACNSDGTCAC